MSIVDNSEQDDLPVKVEAKIKEFDDLMQRSLPLGLNSPLSKAERALLRTFYRFILTSPPQTD